MKARKKNLAMAWIDYKKAYDMVPHSWIVECLKLFGIAQNVTNSVSRQYEEVEDRVNILWRSLR